MSCQTHAPTCCARYALFSSTEDSESILETLDEATKSKQELEQTKAHIATIESRLHAAQLEVEVVKASEERALSQVTQITHLLHFLIGYTFCLALIMFFFLVLQFEYHI